MLHVTVNWSGFTGSPGFTNLYFDYALDLTGVNAAVTASQQFADQIHTFLPTGVTVQASTEVEQIDPANGDLLGVMTATASSPAWIGTSPGGYSAPSGAVINWRTAGVHRARRVRGRTFVVPLGATNYQADGSLVDSTRTGLATAATNLLASAFGIWARPKGPPPVVAGAFYEATSASVPDKSCVLRSRRD